MHNLEVTPLGGSSFHVAIGTGDRNATAHTVSVPVEMLDDLGLGEADAERLVRASFVFLLAREEPGQILREFSLDVIGHYFPEYRTEITRRIKRE